LLPFTDVQEYLWPKQVPHPELVAGELDFGLPGSVGRGSQLDPDETGGIRILSPEQTVPLRQDPNINSIGGYSIAQTLLHLFRGP
jgi:hypothetical protein